MDDETGVRQDLQVGAARVRMAERTIEVDGELRQVDHKALRVLSCLLARPGTVVAKRELLDHVWSDSFVTDDVLTAAISRLRRAFGDASRTPHTIETVPSVGYRLIAPVRSLSADSARRRHRRWVIGMVAVALAVVAIRLTVDRVAPPPGEPTALRSLAVLPLENLTGDSDQAHLAAGMTEAWITGLARQPGWRVTVGASVRRYAEARPPLGEVADALDVDVLVEGALQRSGDRLRVSARLVAADDLRLLWAGTFDGSADEIFDLQERAVVVMARQLGPDDAVVGMSRPPMPVEPAAYESYLRARYLLAQPPTRRSLNGAVAMLDEVIAEEPDYVPAHLALAEAYLALGEAVLVPPRSAFGPLRRVAERARALDPGASRPEALLAMVHLLHDHDFAAAERRFVHALELDSDDLLARDGYSRLLTVTGRFDKALEQQRLLRELNPLIYHLPYLATIHNMARRHESALRELERQLAIEARAPRLHSHLASTYRWLGRLDEALDPFLTALQLSGATDHEIDGLREAFEQDRAEGVGRFVVRRYQRLEQAGERIPAMSWAEALLLAGERRQAIDQIERAVEEREPRVLQIGNNPDYDDLRDEPRFRALVTRLGLSESRSVAR